MNRNILHVVNVYFVLPYFLGKQLLYFKNKGYNEHIVCSPSEKIKSYSESHCFKYLEIPIFRKMSFFSDLRAIVSICRYIKRSGIDIVVGHTPKAGLLAMLAAYVMQVPKRIYFRHGLLYETSIGIKKYIFIFSEKMASCLATDIVCVSPYLIEKSVKDRLSSFNKMLLLNRGSCNGVDVFGQFNPDNIDCMKLGEIREKYGISKDAWVIGYTGRLVKDKGIIELVGAYQILKTRYPDLYLLLVGPKEERDGLPTEIMNIIKNDEGIILTGLIDEDIEYYYALMNVLVLASFREGFGTSILEASAMEVPVLTTSHTGCRDAILSGQTGLFVEHSSLSIASNIEALINNLTWAGKLGVNGRIFIKKYFDQHLIWNEIEKLYLK